MSGLAELSLDSPHHCYNLALCPAPGAAATHSATSFDLGPLQSDGDTVEEDEGQDHIVKKLVSNNGLTQDPEPEWKSRNPREGQFASHSDQKEDRTTVHTQGPSLKEGISFSLSVAIHHLPKVPNWRLLPNRTPK